MGRAIGSIVGVLVVLGFGGMGGAEEVKEDPRLVAAQSDVEQAKELREAGKYAQAVTLVERALKVREEILPGNDLKVAECLDWLGVLHLDLEHLALVEPLFQRAIQLREAIQGKDHPDLASSLHNLAALYDRQGSYERAQALYQRALEIRQGSLGPNHPDVAWSLISLSTLYEKQAAHASAKPLMESALAILTRALGSKHPVVATALDIASVPHLQRGEFAEAERLVKRALKIRKAALGAGDPAVVSSLNNLAGIYYGQGRYRQAESLYRRALEISETALGPHHPAVAMSLNHLASLYYRQEAYGRAEPLYLRALEMMEAVLGSDHPDVASALTNLAGLYYRKGAYWRAEPLFLRALRISEATLGPNHPHVAAALGNLAYFYGSQGEYGQAEPLFLRALKITEATLGPDHPDVASALTSLADLYNEQRVYARAAPLYLRALKIREATLGARHPETISSLYNLAGFYEKQEAYARSEPFYQRALEMTQATFGRGDLEAARSFGRLALFYSNQGKYDQAAFFWQSALAIWERRITSTHAYSYTTVSVSTSFSPSGGLRTSTSTHFHSSTHTSTSVYWHRDAAAVFELASIPYIERGEFTAAEIFLKRAVGIDPSTALASLARFYVRRGDYGRAQFLFRRALKLNEAKSGPHHPDVATALDDLALFYQEQRDYNKAEPLFWRALNIRERALGPKHPQVAAALHRLATLRIAQGRLAEATRLLERHLAISEHHLRQETINLSESRLASFRHLQNANHFLYVLAHSFPDSPEVLRLALATALLRKDRSVDTVASVSRTIYRSLGTADRELFERLRALRTQYAALSFNGLGKLSSQEYQQRLGSLETQADTLEAELAQRSAPLRAQRQLPGAEDIVPRVTATLPKDAALVEIVGFALPGPGPRISQEEIPPTPNHYLALVLFPSGDIRVASLGSAAPINAAVGEFRRALTGSTGEHEAVAQKLYQLVMTPIVRLLGSKRRLFIAPDGDLHLIPFGALHDGQRYLLDTYDTSYLTSGRDFLPRSTDSTAMRAAVVLADPDFRGSPEPPSPVGEHAEAPSTRSFALERFRQDEAPQLQQMTPSPLPGTRQEATLIQRLFPDTQLFLGLQATANALFQVTAPQILHIATHGFFLQDEKGPRSSAIRVRAWDRSKEESVGSPPPLPMPESPMLRSGLITAGSNLVTALELTGLNLWGTQLVVLSACETGLGDTQIGQGVAGLRRAFVIAGAETVVTSLWKVKDDVAPELMDHYYRGLVAGQGRGEAMLAAMRAIRREHPHPYFWAPFIVVGKVDPLRTQAASAGQR